MNKIKEKKRSKLIYSDQNCKKKVTPDVQRDLQTKSLTNLAKRYVNENKVQNLHMETATVLIS